MTLEKTENPARAARPKPKTGPKISPQSGQQPQGKKRSKPDPRTGGGGSHKKQWHKTGPFSGS